ncbi:MAG TPA: hypothetical protein PLH29_00340 [bacterium]|nr:hypothetical protein [bacterium]
MKDHSNSDRDKAIVKAIERHRKKAGTRKQQRNKRRGMRNADRFKPDDLREKLTRRGPWTGV